MRTLLDLAEPPTAVVFANDLMAMAGLSLALSRGVSVPGDLSVTGFDDIEISAHLQPVADPVHTDVVAWGRAAATRLLQLIDLAEPTPADLPGRTTRRALLDRTRPSPDRPLRDRSTDETQAPRPPRSPSSPSA